MPSGFKHCPYCKEIKVLTEFNKSVSRCKSCYKLTRKYYPEREKRYKEAHIEQKRIWKKEWDLKNKEHIQEYRKNYYNLNKEWIIQGSTIRNNKRRKEDILFRLANNLRKRIGIALKKGKKQSQTLVLLGCSLENFRFYIESKFIIDMTWENYGLRGWHLDHIIPLSSAKTVDELEKLCHYTNLRPLWWKENLLKGSKLL